MKCSSPGIRYQTSRSVARGGMHKGGGSPSPKELPPQTIRFSGLGGRFFFDRYEFVAELLRLPFDFGFEPFLPLSVALRPKCCVVFNLLLHHRVEDNRDLVRDADSRADADGPHIIQRSGQRRVAMEDGGGCGSPNEERTFRRHMESPSAHPL